MRDLFRKKVVIFCIFSFIAIVIGIFLLSETIARMITIFSILIVAAIVFAANMEKSDVISVLMMAAPTFSTLLAGLARNGFADGLMEWYNARIAQGAVFLGISVNFRLEAESSLVLTFWGLVALAWFFRCIFAWRVEQEKRPEFREKKYSEKRDMFCKTLRQRIDRINRETDWNESTFTPLDAEIEACINKKRKKKYDDLLKCLKAYRKRNTVFLVLGDPGAGKSVAMRKLSLDLLDDAHHSGLVPVYVDLKKWSEPWNINHLPTKRDLLTFIISVLKENGDFSADDFVDTYFDKMLENGCWYFIFDSFDEMPCLMGVKNCKELIDEISDLLYKFLTGPEQRGGVIASRLFRAPTETLRPTVTMTIQPFSDIKIRTMLKKYSSSSYEMDRQLFGEREDLVALCRNPFYLSLLINYFKYNGEQLPANQMELYNSFVETRLTKCSGKIELEGMSVFQLREAAKELAQYMNQSQKYGLECPIQALCCQDDNMKWQKVLNLLAYAKICRFGGENKTVSFVHRRFQEFFHVESILARGDDVTEDNYESIVKNSGFRDALVLYCEVSDNTQARKIAEYCWGKVKENMSFRNSIHESGCRELVNTLYFMKEAFRNRKSVLSEFWDDFQQLVQENIGTDPDSNSDDKLPHSSNLSEFLKSAGELILKQYRAEKVAISKTNRLVQNKECQRPDFAVLLALTNSIVLFEPHRIQEMVLRIFKLKNRWLNDIVMLNCRLMTTKLDYRIEKEIIMYFQRLSVKEFLSRYRNTDFSLSLCKPFVYIRIMHTARLIYELTFTFLFAAVVLLCVFAKNTFISFFDVQSPEMLVLCLIMSICATMPMVLPLFEGSDLPSIIKSWLFTTIPIGVLTLHAYAYGKGVWIAIGCAFIWDFCGTAYFLIPIVYEVVLLIRKTPKLFFIRILVGIVFLGVVTAFINLAGQYIETMYICFLVVGGVFLLFTKMGRRSLVDLFVRIIVEPIKYIYNYYVDGRWQKSQPVLDRISRIDLADKLHKHPTSKWRRVYIDKLLQNKTILMGMWPSGTRPHFNDDELDFKMMKLDCAEMDDLCKPF